MLKNIKSTNKNMHKMNFLFILLSYNKISILSIPSSFYHATKKVVHILIPAENYYSIMLEAAAAATTGGGGGG